jgi:hypothetical protein
MQRQLAQGLNGALPAGDSRLRGFSIFSEISENIENWVLGETSRRPPVFRDFRDF